MKKMRDVSPAGIAVIDLFRDYLNSRGLHPRTIQEYLADLKHFIGWHEYKGIDNCHNQTPFSFSQITATELATYLQAMRLVHLKSTTINRRLTTLKLFFEWAEQRHMTAANPADSIRLIPLAKKTPSTLSADDMKKLLATVKTHGSLRDQAMLKLMIRAGLRAGEICSLKQADLNDNGRLLIGGHQSRRRQISLDAVCRSILEQYLPTIRSGSDFLFPSEKTGGRLTERAVRHLIKKYLDLAGFSGLSALSLSRCFIRPGNGAGPQKPRP